MRPAGRSNQSGAKGYSARSSQAGTVISAAELIRDVADAAREHVPVLLGRQVLGLAGAVLGGARDEHRLEAQRPGRGEVVVVGGDPGVLLWAQPEQGRGAEVAAGLRLVVARHLGAENRVPR